MQQQQQSDKPETYTPSDIIEAIDALWSMGKIRPNGVGRKGDGEVCAPVFMPVPDHEREAVRADYAARKALGVNPTVALHEEAAKIGGAL